MITITNYLSMSKSIKDATENDVKALRFKLMGTRVEEDKNEVRFYNPTFGNLIARVVYENR